MILKNFPGAAKSGSGRTTQETLRERQLAHGGRGIWRSCLRNIALGTRPCQRNLRERRPW